MPDSFATEVSPVVDQEEQNNTPLADRQKIISVSYPEIKTKLDRITRKRGKFERTLGTGPTFEVLAINEQLLNRQETEQQTELREIIEGIFQNTSLIFGGKPQSNPDFVRVLFETDGTLVIDGIVEIKASLTAEEIGELKNQPQKTINTAERILNIINQLIDDQPTEPPLILDGLSETNIQKRQTFLDQVKQKLEKLSIKRHITFSEELEYITLLPNGIIQNKDRSSLKLTDGQEVKRHLINSQFSRIDIYNIIDHYAETP